MKSKLHSVLLKSVLFCLICLSINSAFAQEELWKEEAPWKGVPEYYHKWKFPDFKFPADLPTWKNERIKVSETLIRLLGDIPARPKDLKVKTVFKKQMNGYTLEKFLIDNGVDGWIPGYLAIPTQVKGKVPVILGLHGHGSSKDNIIGSNSSTAQDVLALLISKG